METSTSTLLSVKPSALFHPHPTSFFGSEQGDWAERTCFLSFTFPPKVQCTAQARERRGGEGSPHPHSPRRGTYLGLKEGGSWAGPECTHMIAALRNLLLNQLDNLLECRPFQGVGIPASLHYVIPAKRGPCPITPQCLSPASPQVYAKQSFQKECQG